MPDALGLVSSILMQHITGTYAFDDIGGMTPEQALNWFRDIVVANVEKLLSKRA